MFRHHAMLVNYSSGFISYFKFLKRFFKGCCPGSTWNSESQQCERMFPNVNFYLNF